jgi:SAM-dependent methyltransferase
LNHPGPTLGSTVGNWWRLQRQQFSWLFTLKQLAGLTWEFLRDSLPDRKRQRYGDADYDWEFRLDTTGATVGWRTRLLGMFYSGYQPIEPYLFREMLSKLAIDFREFTFIDIGSGKGRALLLAAECPFRRIVGIELLAELNAVAQANIRKLQDRSAREPNIEAICGNATDYAFPEDPLVLYLFNPLSVLELNKVMRNLDQSIKRNSRPVYLVYANPIWEREVIDRSLFSKTVSTQYYSIFAHTPRI